MARSNAVWCIDIGQASLKALRCRVGDEPNQVYAEAFDFIAYPKILSQPGADPVELVQDALKTFLSRHSLKGDRVAVSVPGQNGLARFIKLPPVESKKIPDIVKYEAKQQIPFDLDDVIWDYQRLGVSTEEDGFALETEIGLFAMKRDQVLRCLEPFNQAGIEVDYIQLTPLALYNYLLFDRLEDRMPSADQYDPDSPPRSTAILSMGTDSTDLVITNGFRVWQRNIPIGGSHFTKALTKELKLTFSKAEKIKCNAAKAKDPKVLFKAMRPVFNDLLTELQRSIGYFSSLDKNAKIKRIIGLGNALKMPGLRRYLSQSLGIEMVRADSFAKMAGPEVLGTPGFKENHLSFGVCYGLAVQALGQGKSTLKTNLIPGELVRDRIIREKKPWMAAATGLVLLACGIGFTTASMALSTVAAEKFKSAEAKCKQVGSKSSNLKSEEQSALSELDATVQIGQHLIGNVDNRLAWLEMVRAVNECLPRNPIKKNAETGQEEETRPEKIESREEINVTSIECQQVGDFSRWWSGVESFYQAPDLPKTKKDKEDEAEEEEEAEIEGPEEGEPGWIIQLTGHHYHNPPTSGQLMGPEYVRETLLKNLHTHRILLPTADKNAVDEQGNPKTHELVSMEELGISFPVLIGLGALKDEVIVDPTSLSELQTSGNQKPSGNRRSGSTSASRPAAAKPKTITARRYDFVIQFGWKPTPPTARLTKKLEDESGEEE